MAMFKLPEGTNRTINPAYVEWCANLFASLNEGGKWGLPRSGLVFEKRGNEFFLIQRMPHSPGMPISETDLHKQQENDLEGTRLHFAAAGITVRDETASETRH